MKKEKKLEAIDILPTQATPNSELEYESVANGPVLILLVVLLVSVLGGMYYWFSVLQTNTPVVAPTTQRPSAIQNNEPESTTIEAQVEALGVVSTSDEIPAIEADVEGTTLDPLEGELDAIEAEIDAALITKPSS